MRNDVFLRTATDETEISSASYNLIIGACLVWGFVINYLIVTGIDPRVLQSTNTIVFLLAYFGLCFAGIWLFNHSTKPLYSFIGYNLVVIPFGFCLNLIISAYDPYIVSNAIQLTGGVTLIMMILGTLYPQFFSSIIKSISVILLITIIVEVIMVLFMRKSSAIIDWIIALCFCGYIGYDWGRANRIPKTTDNAIDSAAAIYIDIINLFVRILRIMGRRRR